MKLKRQRYSWGVNPGANAVYLFCGYSFAQRSPRVVHWDFSASLPESDNITRSFDGDLTRSAMTCDEMLRKTLLTVEVNEDYTEAVMRFKDNSRLCFCHRVDERWAKAVGPEEHECEGGQAEEVLVTIKMFRLNRKHLDIQFVDGSRWDESADGFDPPVG